MSLFLTARSTWERILWATWSLILIGEAMCAFRRAGGRNDG
jgi:hypothetical protein